MSWTKRQFIEQAFDELGLAQYAYELDANQLNSALRRLDSMMASWDAKGIRLGYPLTANPDDSNIDDQTNVPDMANEAIYLNLAKSLAPSYGKVVSRETKTGAYAAYMAVMNASVKPIELQYPSNTPLGAGNKPSIFNRRFVTKPDTSPIGTDASGQLDFKG